MNDLQWAYLAGIIDGEGTIGIVAPYKGARGGRVELSVANTSPVLIEWLRATGYGRVHPKQRAKAWHKDAWAWNVRGHQIEEVLSGVIPYLVIKAPHARLALQFLETVHSTSRLPDNVIALRAQMQTKMRDLNQKGTREKEQAIG
jgi:hypothetical protein